MTHLLQQGQLLNSIKFQQLGIKYLNIRASGGWDGILIQITTGVPVREFPELALQSASMFPEALPTLAPSHDPQTGKGLEAIRRPWGDHTEMSFAALPSVN